MIKVLLATNDSALERMLRVTLTINGLSVTPVSHLSAVLEQLENDEFNILLLDSFYSDIGVVIRQKGYNLPILALTSPPMTSSVRDVEYIDDPFNFPALKQKMNGMLKKRYSLSEKFIENGHLKIDMINQLAIIKDEAISLGKIEFAILASLARKAGKIVSKEKMRIDLEAQGHFFNTTIYHHIRELKLKLKDATANKLSIKFITGEGYQLSNEG